MKIFLSLFLIISALFSADLLSDTLKDYLSAQDGEVDWANSVRGAARGKTGLAMLSESNSDTFDFQPLLQQLDNITDTKDLILPVGGLGSARRGDRVDNYMRLIRYDKGERWRRLVYEQTTAVAKRSPQRQVFWQIGNEINSWHYVETVSPWEGSDEVVVRDPLEDISAMNWTDPEERSRLREHRKQVAHQFKKLRRNDSNVIPLYVEYFLAPTAQAIMDARKDCSDGADRIKIVLGSIANSSSEKARVWLESLLNYRIRGVYSEQLAGQRVSDIVDIIALHYIVSSPGPQWRDALRGLYGKWLGTGSIRGIWSTEEIGRKRAIGGLGGASAISVVSRSMDLWHEFGINSRQGRVNLWGWNSGDQGTRGGDAMQTLLSLVGDTQLIPLHEGEVNLHSSGDYESYFFKTTQGKLVITQFAANKGARPGFSGFQTNWHGENVPRVKVIVFGQSGQNEPETEVKLENGLLTVSTQRLLSTREVVLVVVDHD